MRPRRYAIYYYCGIQKVLMMCGICHKFCVSIIEKDDMRNHLINEHPESCHSCNTIHNGNICTELFMNNNDLREHKRSFKIKSN